MSKCLCMSSYNLLNVDSLIVTNLLLGTWTQLDDWRWVTRSLFPSSNRLLFYYSWEHWKWPHKSLTDSNQFWPKIEMPYLINLMQLINPQNWKSVLYIWKMWAFFLFQIFPNINIDIVWQLDRFNFCGAIFNVAHCALHVRHYTS